MIAFRYLFLGSGLVFGLHAIVTIVAQVRLLRRGVRVTGRIVERDQVPDGEYGTTPLFVPLIRFKDAEGNDVEIQPDESMDESHSRIGKKIDLVYPHGQPRYATLATASTIGAPVLQLIVAVACAAVGVFLIPR